MVDVKIAVDSLAPHERLWVWRKRKDMRQDAAALALGYSRQRYSLMENGRRPVRRMRSGLYCDFTPEITPHELSSSEVLAILRRRSGLTQREHAAAMGVSEPTARRGEEQGGVWLFSWWKARKRLKTKG